MTKSQCSWTLFPWEICPKPEIQKSFHMLVHTITLNTVTKYKEYPYIQTSIKSNLKYLEKWLSLTVHQPFFPGKVAPRPEIQKPFPTRVHTIILNTVTKYKLYPYIQTSLNQIIGIFNNLKILKND